MSCKNINLHQYGKEGTRLFMRNLAQGLFPTIAYSWTFNDQIVAAKASNFHLTFNAIRIVQAQENIETEFLLLIMIRIQYRKHKVERSFIKVSTPVLDVNEWSPPPTS